MRNRIALTGRAPRRRSLLHHSASDARFRQGALLLALLFAAMCCRSSPSSAAVSEPIVILISFDGFRWDYLEKAETPHLDSLAADGVRAEGLIPVFPAKTFPSHYSIVTGLYPENHGVVSNNMVDRELEGTFSLSNRDAVGDGRWWGGEPIWSTLARHGKKSATLYWPGSEAEIGGRRPTYWIKYDQRKPYEERVQTVLNWLDLPAEDRPAFITLYFAAADGAGHDHGPDSPQVAEAVRRLDETTGLLVEGLRARGLFDKVHLIIVSDHGMAAQPSDNAIFLDDCLELSSVRVIDWSPVLALTPKGSDLETVRRKLVQCSTRWRVFRKEETPARLHYRNHRRIPPLIAIADEGWAVTTHGRYERVGGLSPGNHGYDNQLRSMWGIFIAHGPSLRSGFVTGPFLNIHIYALMAEILEVAPAPSDADLNQVRQLLKEESRPLKPAIR